MLAARRMLCAARGAAQSARAASSYQGIRKTVEQFQAELAADKEFQAERWKGIRRDYKPDEVERLRGNVDIQYTLADRGARRLWKLLKSEAFVPALGAMTGNQAVQQARAGLKAVYMSGWQVAADANTGAEMFPDQSLYPVDSGPEVVRRINNALKRADEISSIDAVTEVDDWFLPIVADVEAGFGGPLNTFELVKNMIRNGAAGVHLEDQLASEKKCGHLGGKVLVPTGQYIRQIRAARLASDVCNVPTVIVARTDANSAELLTSDFDERDKPFLTGERTPDGFFRLKNGLDLCINRAMSYAPYADLLWFETSLPDLKEARRFAEAVHAKYPGKMLAYNCSPSFNWKAHLSEDECRMFQIELGKLGYKFQFVTLAGFHALNYSMFTLSRKYKKIGMAAYSELQEAEIAEQENGYTAVKHQREVGTGYFDAITNTVSRGEASTTALKDSTEEAQF